MAYSTIVMCVVASAIVLLIPGAILFSRWLFKPVRLTAVKTGDPNLDEAQTRVEARDLELGILEDLGFDHVTMNAAQEELAIAEMTRDLAQSTHERQKAIRKTRREHATGDSVVVRKPQRTVG
jgi:hypothetical protein